MLHVYLISNMTNGLILNILTLGQSSQSGKCLTTFQKLSHKNKLFIGLTNILYSYLYIHMHRSVYEIPTSN